MDPFLMELSQAPGIINLTAPDEIQCLASLLSPDLIRQAFSGAVPEILRLLIGLPRASPGAIPGHLKHFYSNAEMLKLPPRREREYAPEVREKRLKYPFKNNAGHLK